MTKEEYRELKKRVLAYLTDSELKSGKPVTVFGKLGFVVDNNPNSLHEIRVISREVYSDTVYMVYPNELRHYELKCANALQEYVMVLLVHYLMNEGKDILSELFGRNSLRPFDDMLDSKYITFLSMYDTVSIHKLSKVTDIDKAMDIVRKELEVSCKVRAINTHAFSRQTKDKEADLRWKHDIRKATEELLGGFIEMQKN